MGENMDQEKLNKILQIVGELTINLRIANEEIVILNEKLKKLETKIVTNVKENLENK